MLIALLVLLAHALLLIWLGAQVQITLPVDQPPSVTGVLIAPEKHKAVAPPQPVNPPQPNKPAQIRKTPEPQPDTPIAKQAPAVAPSPASSQNIQAATTPGPAPTATSNPDAMSKPAPVLEQQTVTPPRQDATSLSNTAPAYPALSRRLGEEGRVLLDVYILADGSVGELKLKKSSGSSRLDEAAIKAVKNWKYIPAKQGGQAIAFWYVQPVSFVLNNP